jgi:hypothetical protein
MLNPWFDSHQGSERGAGTANSYPLHSGPGSRERDSVAPRKSPPGATAPAEDLGRVADGVREVVRALAPELRIEKRWGQPWYVGTDLVFLVGAFSHHVGIEFWRGTTLRDPHRLLEGTGKNLRHVKVRTTAEATDPALIQLLREAIRLDRTEPPRTRSVTR